MSNIKICVVGLGYVGLPLAVEFSKYFETVGFDINQKRIDELKKKKDRTNEVSKEELEKARIFFTTDASEIKKCNFIIVAVPTPIDKNKKPDLSYVKDASKIVGENLTKDSIVVYEPTVYPGVTEEICVPILEKYSGLKYKKKFKVGYSPERINPGDKEHTVDKIVKIISATDEESLKKIGEVYSKIVKAGLFKAKNIKTAEAAKVIENVQRDLNIALVNELALIFEKIGINTIDVIKAAATKWNFQSFYPGLVGGHCIGIDPYYLTYKAEQLGYKPKIILAGREINEYMAKHVANLVIKNLKRFKKKIEDSKVLILGLTFKENVPDSRNSKALDLINYLKEKGIEVIAFEPLLSKEEIKEKFGVENKKIKEIDKVDAVVLVNKHKKFKDISLEALKEKMDKPILIDIKSFFDKEEAEKLGFSYVSL